MTDSQQVRIRRLQDTLIIAGDAVIAFSAWGLVKAALFLMFADSDRVSRLLSSVDESLLVYVFAFVGILVLIDSAARVFVGISARAEGRGKKKGVFYLVVAVLAAIGNAFSAVATALGPGYALSTLDMMVTIAVEVTALAALMLVVYSAVRLRTLNKATG